MNENTECCLNCFHFKKNTDICWKGQKIGNELETKKCKHFEMYYVNGDKRIIVVNNELVGQIYLNGIWEKEKE